MQDWIVLANPNNTDHYRLVSFSCPVLNIKSNSIFNIRFRYRQSDIQISDILDIRYFRVSVFNFRLLILFQVFRQRFLGFRFYIFGFRVCSPLRVMGYFSQSLNFSVSNRLYYDILYSNFVNQRYDQPGWSLKYNMVFQNILDLFVYPDSVMEMEINYYMENLHPYGIPLDVRR